jgi:hypothetical protein
MDEWMSLPFVVNKGHDFALFGLFGSMDHKPEGMVLRMCGPYIKCPFVFTFTNIQYTQKLAVADLVCSGSAFWDFQTCRVLRKKQNETRLLVRHAVQ